jgi:hypothetical protein
MKEKKTGTTPFLRYSRSDCARNLRRSTSSDLGISSRSDKPVYDKDGGASDSLNVSLNSATRSNFSASIDGIRSLIESVVPVSSRDLVFNMSYQSCRVRCNRISDVH